MTEPENRLEFSDVDKPIYLKSPEPRILSKSQWREIRLPFVVFSTPGREAFRLTPDRKIVVADDVYKAAMAFWEMVRCLAPDSFKVEVDNSKS